MALPASQNVNMVYSGAVPGTTTAQLISAITGNMLQAGWTITGATTLRSVADDAGRFIEMEVLQNNGAALSHQIQFAVYKTTKAADANVLINNGFQMQTGQTYKIHASPFSIYTEMNNGTLAQGNNAFAFLLYSSPLDTGILPAAIYAGGHRNYAGTAFSTTHLYQMGTVFNGTSGTVGGQYDLHASNAAAAVFGKFHGGRLFVNENWATFNLAAEQVVGRPYLMLSAGTNGGGGFDLPSGTGTISYVRLDALGTAGTLNLHLRYR